MMVDLSVVEDMGELAMEDVIMKCLISYSCETFIRWKEDKLARVYCCDCTRCIVCGGKEVIKGFREGGYISTCTMRSTDRVKLMFISYYSYGYSSECCRGRQLDQVQVMCVGAKCRGKPVDITLSVCPECVAKMRWYNAMPQNGLSWVLDLSYHIGVKRICNNLLKKGEHTPYLEGRDSRPPIRSIYDKVFMVVCKRERQHRARIRSRDVHPSYRYTRKGTIYYDCYMLLSTLDLAVARAFGVVTSPKYTDE